MLANFQGRLQVFLDVLAARFAAGLLDALGGSGLASGFGGELLAGGLSSGGLAGSLIGPCHVVLLCCCYRCMYV